MIVYTLLAFLITLLTLIFTLSNVRIIEVAFLWYQTETSLAAAKIGRACASDRNRSITHSQERPIKSTSLIKIIN
jgi:hypothetical protein